MDLLELNCDHCGYHKRVLAGTSDRSQSLSDLIEDFSYYHLFLCPTGKEIQSLDVTYDEFDGKCILHDAELKELKELPTACPKCGNNFEIVRKSLDNSK